MESSQIHAATDLLEAFHPAPSALPWLEEWLLAVGLTSSEYLERAIAWCDEQGAVSVCEVEDNWEDFADALRLTNSERHRLAKSCTHGSILEEEQPRAAPEAPQSAEISQVRQGLRNEVPRRFCSNGPGASMTYEIQERLGRGATATVYRCTCEGRDYAVKAMDLQRLRLNPRFAELREIMNREATLLLKLKHPRIVAFHDMVDTGAWHFHVMEFVAGGELGSDLAHHIAQHGRMSEAAARYIFVQLLEGLQYIHSKNIMHRDMKCENILVDAGRSQLTLIQVKIADFGHSKLVRDGYQASYSAVGTRHYWAPEVSNANPRRPATYDEKVDIWSLGVVLYVMLVGKYPFATNDAALTGKLNFRGRRDADDLLHQLIEVDVRRRISLTACLQSPWVVDGALSSLPTLANHVQDCETGQPRVMMRLPRAPRDVPLFKADLNAYERKYRVSVTLNVLEVVVTFPPEMEPSVVDQARAELRRLVALYLPELGRLASEEGRNFGPVDEAAAAAWEDERVSLEVIYNDEFKVLGRAEWLIQLSEGVALHVCLPPGYPHTEPPIPLIKCTRRFAPFGLARELLQLWSPGEVCVFAWVDHLKRFLEDIDSEGDVHTSFSTQATEPLSNPSQTEIMAPAPCKQESDLMSHMSLKELRKTWHLSGADMTCSDIDDGIDILNGKPISDKNGKWMCHAHLACVNSLLQVNSVHRRLLADKLAGAGGCPSHNIVAYRLRGVASDGRPGEIVSDHDDDSEGGIGNRLASILEQYDADNVFIMVTRRSECEGSYLGPFFFKQVRRVAVMLLEQAGLSERRRQKS